LPAIHTKVARLSEFGTEIVSRRFGRDGPKRAQTARLFASAATGPDPVRRGPAVENRPPGGGRPASRGGQSSSTCGRSVNNI